MPTEKFEVTRSEISTWLRCENKWNYSYRQNMKDQDLGSVAMSEGTLGHVGLAAAYSYMKNCQIGDEPPPSLETGIDLALFAMRTALTKGSVPYRGVEQPLAVKADDKETTTRMCDVVTHYLKTHFLADYRKYKIMSVEQEYEASFTFLDSTGQWVSAVVTGAMDTVAQNTTFEKRVASITDHKFVGDVGNALDFLPLDTQMLFYEAIMCEVLIFGGDFDDVEIIYDLHRREVPPGFGNRILRTNKDGSVAKNNASQDPDDYVKRAAPIRHSRNERVAIVKNLVVPLLSDVWDYRQGRNRSFPRRLIRTGGEACSNCFAQARCSHDILGRHMPDFSKFVEAQTKT